MEIQFGDCIFEGQFGYCSQTFKNFAGALSKPGIVLGYISMKIFDSIFFLILLSRCLLLLNVKRLWYFTTL